VDAYLARHPEARPLGAVEHLEVGRHCGHLIVGIQTDSAYGTSCELGAATLPPSVGAAFAVVTVGQAAERLPARVLLHDFLIP
jgi:hypothetical protein